MTLIIELLHGDAQALDDVSVQIDQGTIVAIVGANGAGKTSLIRTIAGMHRPARGRIAFRGTDIGGWESYRVCNLGIGQVAEGRQVFPTLSVAENLEIGAMLPRARTRQLLREARDAFREALPTDDATWERARGWVLSQAVAALAYYTPDNNPSLYMEAENWLELGLLER